MTSTGTCWQTSHFSRASSDAVGMRWRGERRPPARSPGRQEPRRTGSYACGQSRERRCRRPRRVGVRRGHVRPDYPRTRQSECSSTAGWPQSLGAQARPVSGEPTAILYAMQVKPIAGCGWKWFYQQLQSLDAAGDGPISPPACSPSCSPTSRLPPPPGGAGLVGCYSPHYCQAA